MLVVPILFGNKAIGVFGEILIPIFCHLKIIVKLELVNKHDGL